MAIFNLNINGKKQQVDVDPATPMLWVLREEKIDYRVLILFAF
jgi:aerobic-type carbon monoxide dehydrogenase small subunit (CoxS/CutS family)